MLNPSTADAEVDDPTIRRCIGFARRDGITTMAVANLFAARETASRLLRMWVDPVGPDNDRHLFAMAGWADEVVVAWGARSKLPKAWRHREQEVLGLLPAGVFCLGTTKDGSPNHPLFLPAGQPLVPYREAAHA